MNLLHKNKNKIIIAVILLLAAFLRLYRISEYMTFLGDEGRDVLVVYNILHGHLTLLGPTSSVGGFFTGPIYYYFMTPFLWLFNYDPVGPAVMVALFGVLTVYLVYKICKEFFGSTAGLVASGLYSISPLVIAYSHSSWNPNLMPISTLITLYLLYKAVLKFDKKLFVFSGITFGIAMQLHYVMSFIGVLMALYILSAYKKNLRKAIAPYIYVLIGFLIGFSPFLGFEARHGFQNIHNILVFIFNPTGKDAISNNMGFIPTIWNVFFRIFGRLVTGYPPPEQQSIQAHVNYFFWYFGTVALALGSTIMFVKQFLKENDVDKKLQLKLILFWLVAGVGIFGFYRKNIYDYYFEFMFPLPFFLVGNFLSNIWDKKNSKRFIAPIILVALIVINLLLTPLREPANQQLKQTKEIASFVLSKTDNKPYNFALISGGNSDHAYRYFFKIWGRDPIEIGHENAKGTNITDQLLVICEDPVCQPLGDPSWQIAGFGRAEISDEWKVSVVRVFKLVKYKGK